MIFLSNIPDKMRYAIYLAIIDFFKNFLGEIRLEDLKKQIKIKLDGNEEFQKMKLALEEELIHEHLRKKGRIDSTVRIDLGRKKIEEKIKSEISQALYYLFITLLNNMAITGDISIHKVNDSFFIEKNMSRSRIYNFNEPVDTESEETRNNTNEDNLLNQGEVSKKIIDLLSDEQATDEVHEEKTENGEEEHKKFKLLNPIQELIIKILSGPWGEDGRINVYILFKVLATYDYNGRLSLEQFSGPKNFKFTGLLKDLEKDGLISLEGDSIIIKNINYSTSTEV